MPDSPLSHVPVLSAPWIRFNTPPAGGVEIPSDVEVIPPTKKDPPGLDLTSKVKLGDGKEVTVAELIEAKSRLSTLETEVTGLRSSKDRLKAILGDTSPEQKREAIIAELKAQNYTDDKIKAVLASIDEDEGNTEEESSQSKDKGSQSKDKKPQSDEELTALKAKIAQLEAQQTEVEFEGILSGLSSELDAQAARIDKKVIAASTKQVGEERTNTNLAAIKEVALEKAQREVALKVRDHLSLGRKPSRQDYARWTKEAVQKCLDDGVQRWKGFIGDTALMGGADNVSAETLLQRKPVEPPKNVSRANQAEVERQLHAHIADGLERMAASTQE